MCMARGLRRHRGFIQAIGEDLMNRDVMQGKWREMKGKVKEQWGKLTDDDLDKIEGTSDQLLGLLQQRYGYARETREKVIDLGPIKATKETEKTIPLPPILGGAALAGGVVLLIAGARSK